MANVTDFDKQVEMQVLNHSIFVWGGSGQLCKNVNEAWIRKKEANNEGGKHADDAVAAWKAVMASPYADVARCFDCSGYVSYCLKQIGALKDRTNCDGLYAKCEPLEKVEDGALLFRVNPKDPNDETHVGMYFDGKQYHAKGRADGVVAEAYKSSYWAKTAWFKTLKRDEPEPPEPTVQIAVKGTVRVRRGNGKRSKKICTVGERGKVTYLPYLGQAPESPYWYMTRANGQDGYITSDPKYTYLICG